MRNWGEIATPIAVSVDYYNDAHRKELNKYPTAEAIEQLVQSGFEVKVEEFLTYFLFHRVRYRPDIYTGYESVRAAIADAEAMLHDFVEIDNGALILSDGALALPKEVTERIGESVTLSAMNRLHGLTEADWVPLPEVPGKKVLDYEHASDARHHVQVEAKASVVDDTSLKGGSISDQRKSIEDKKLESGAAVPGVLRYGVIVAISSNHEELKCWLLDPVANAERRSPENLRLIARLEFLRWIVWLVSPRSLLATAIATRVAAVTRLRDPYELAQVPLTHSDGSPFEIRYNIIGFERHAAFFGSRSRVENGPAGGIVVRVPNQDALLFIGFREELLEIAAAQDFGRIGDYSAEVGSVRKTVLCTVPQGEFRSFRISPERLPNFSQSGTYARFELEGTLRYSEEGLVFGVLPVPSSGSPKT